jgi:hypothetical protein
MVSEFRIRLILITHRGFGGAGHHSWKLDEKTTIRILKALVSC